MKNLQKYLSTCLLATAALLGGASPAWAQVLLGTASGFSVLGGTAVTCTAGSVIGEVGISPGITASFTNTGCTIAGGTPPANNAAAASARADFLNAYAAIRFQSCTQMPGDLAAQNLAPGVYCVDAVAKTGTLTLTGPTDGVWIFLVNGALTGTNFSVVMPGGQGCNNNVFWWTAQAATLTDSVFLGSIHTGTSITVTRGSLDGKALAKGAVTLTGTSVCGGAPTDGVPTDDDDR